MHVQCFLDAALNLKKQIIHFAFDVSKRDFNISEFSMRNTVIILGSVLNNYPPENEPNHPKDSKNVKNTRPTKTFSHYSTNWHSKYSSNKTT